jgi:hypothetical protein
MEDKVLKVISTVYTGAMGILAGYFTYKATQDKTDELTENSKFVKKLLIRTGHLALSTGVGFVVFDAVGGTDVYK